VSGRRGLDKNSLVLGVFPLDQFLPYVGEGKTPIQIEIPIWNGALNFDVRAAGKKFVCFSRSQTCVRCMCHATHWKLESYNEKPAEAFLTLWGTSSDGYEVRMTMDHIRPVSKGGGNNIANLQTMCYPCNQWKGAKVWKPTVNLGSKPSEEMMYILW
jgi:hypothetical protein